MSEGVETTLNGAMTANPSVSAMLYSYEALFDALTAASDISTHFDFYQWLQRDMQNFVPHETLAAVWGDFSSGTFRYDIASSVAGVNTAQLDGARNDSFDQAMYALWRLVQAGEQNWRIVHDFRGLADKIGIDTDSALFQRFEKNVEAVLICGMRCNRGSEDCLYLFSLTDSSAPIDPQALDVLIKHVDASLRRVECFAPHASAEQIARAASLQALSSREREVLHWVSQGKSNEEIGLILDISHNTVKNHLKRVFSKLGVSARSQAVRLYVGGMVSAG